MKVMFDLPEACRALYEEQRAEGEREMYCLPFNFHEGHAVEGYTLFTNVAVYAFIDGTLSARHPIKDLHDFDTEVMLGEAGLYAQDDKGPIEICRFKSGRHLPRYSFVAKGANLIAEKARQDADPGEPKESDEPEKFCPKCGRPYMYNTQICPFCRDDKLAIKRLWELTKGMRLMLCVPMIGAVIMLGLRFFVPTLQQKAIDGFIYPPEGTEPGPVASLIAIIVAILVTSLVRELVSVVRSRASAVSGNRYLSILRSVLYERIQNLSISSIQRHSAGDLLGRVTGDVATIQGFMTGSLPAILEQVIAFVMGLILLLFMAPSLVVYVFIPIPLVAIAFVAVRRYYARLGAQNWKKNYILNCLLHDTIIGERVVKTYGKEASENQRYGEAIDDRTRQVNRAENFSNVFFTILPWLLQLGSYVVLYIGYNKVLHNTWTIGLLSVYTSYMAIVFDPLSALLTIPSQMINLFTAVTKVFEIINEEPEVKDIDLPIDIAVEGDIDVENVTFGYDPFNPVVEDVSLHIKAGEMVGLVGSSGAGKSTMINLIMRLYDVDSGSIKIDDVDIRDISQERLRSQLGVVLQETRLFYGSVRENIAYAKPDATLDEVIRAARLANAHDYITRLPDGYDTIVGDGGRTLSGGEAQRIAIARALIHDPRIVILDEATAALDTETEHMVQEALNTLMKGRTTIAIAHRLSTLRNADRLIVLDRGKVAEVGTHMELLKKKGIYYRLVMAQRLNAV